MRKAETVLTILQERGKRGLVIEQMYRLQYHILEEMTGEPCDTEIGHAGFGEGLLEKCLIR